MGEKLTEAQRAFLARFVARGWLSRERENPAEAAAVRAALRAGYLRRELGEAHFTPSGRAALENGR